MADKNGLGRVARKLARLGRGPEKPLTVTDRLDRWARRIAEFGIVDRAYLEAQTGRRFATDDEAISFYVHNDGQRGLSLSPLVEHEWMREHQPDARMSWYDALHQEGPELFATGPLFDAGIYAATLPSAERPASTLDALRHFVRNATGETTLPVPPGRPGDAPTWAAARDAAVRTARAFADAQHRTRRRYRSTWDGPPTDEVLARYATGAARRDAETPLVSVVMPVFRRADVLGAAIDSVLAQQYPSWELVVVDDGSGDATPDLVRERAATDERIRLVERENGGAGAARNTGLAAVRGEFVAFLDADNTWRPEHLAAAVAALLQDDDVSGVHTGVRMVGANNADDATAPVETYRGEDGTLDDLLAGNFIDLNAVVVRRSVVAAVGPFDEALRRWIDWEWLLRIGTRFGVPRYVPVLGVDYDNVRDARRVSSAQPASWQEVALAPHRIDWDALAGAVRDDTLVSIVMPVFRDWTMTRRAVSAVLTAADADGDRVEVVVVDNGSPRSVSAILGAWFADEPRVQLHREDRNRNFALGSDLGLAWSTGGTVVMLNNDTEVASGWLRPLVDALSDPSVLGAQPLLVYPDGVVQAAGTVFGGDKVLPWHFLGDHPRYDAERALDPSAPASSRRFSAITAAAAAFRAADLLRWRGFDPVYANGLEDVDLCLRALSSSPAGSAFVVVPSSLVVHHESRSPGRDDARIDNRRLFDERWRGRYPAADAAARYAAAGLEYLGVEPGLPKGHRVMVRSSRPVIVRGDSAPLRVAVKHDGSRASDVSDLASALRSAGHDVQVDAPSSWYRGSSGLDEVTVWVGAGSSAAAGAPWVPQPGAVNAVWLGAGQAVPDGEFAVVFDPASPVSAIVSTLAQH
ncbi:glycosyltransferase involved in cell wall biosynthesis [Curtobacterium sp. PhB130]|uniref:glycosyltransferase family 2 protein n=1 Tax=Curtobacterium sp. PhB130 TaxID=2485178 RepID=UPI000FB758CB|nr:glycosyltransferase family 2 protein [Curtobacterium sp. PhB130]ROS74170.1 glycosyltransferase involved in cell wall biosynthesis [Curtobacterium sp. PhB130]